MPMLSAARTRAHRASMVKTSRRSRNTGSSDGLANWTVRLQAGPQRPAELDHLIGETSLRFLLDNVALMSEVEERLSVV